MQGESLWKLLGNLIAQLFEWVLTKIPERNRPVAALGMLLVVLIVIIVPIAFWDTLSSTDFDVKVRLQGPSHTGRTLWLMPLQRPSQVGDGNEAIFSKVDFSELKKNQPIVISLDDKTLCREYIGDHPILLFHLRVPAN